MKIQSCPLPRIRLMVFLFLAVCLSVAASQTPVAPVFETTVLPVHPEGWWVRAAIGDVDGDGLNELVVVDSYSNNLSIVEVRNDGAWIEKKSLYLGPVASLWQRWFVLPVIEDMNGDGLKDIVLYARGNQRQGTLVLLTQTATGFTQSNIQTPETDPAYNFAVADISGDGLPDVVTADHGWAVPAALYLLENRGGTNPFPDAQRIPSPSMLVYVFTADLNGDKRPEVLGATHAWGAEGFVLIPNSGGNLGAPSVVPGPRRTTGVGVGDLNGDGRMDIVTTDGIPHAVHDELSIYRADGSGGYNQPPQRLAPGPGVQTPRIADFNRDGLPDLVLDIKMNHTLGFYLGDPSTGDLSDTPTILWTPELAGTSHDETGASENMSLGDVDNDGDMDIVYSSERVILVRNTTNRTPVADAGPDRVVAAGTECSATLALDGSASNDPDGDRLAYSWEGPFGTVAGVSPSVSLPLGCHVITLTVDDGKGDISTDPVTICVEDRTPPIISIGTAAPNVLWPPNHKLVPVSIAALAADSCSPASLVKIVSVTSNEPVEGLGDGDTGPDWSITGDLTLLLRAERSGNGSGRIYSILLQSKDGAGNISTATVMVMVPKSMGSDR